MGASDARRRLGTPRQCDHQRCRPRPAPYGHGPSTPIGTIGFPIAHPWCTGGDPRPVRGEAPLTDGLVGRSGPLVDSALSEQSERGDARRSRISHAEGVTPRTASRATSYGPFAVATGPHDAV